MKVNEMEGLTVADLGIKYQGGSFDCYRRGLTSLKGSPQVVDGNFDCHRNYLTSLEGAPQEVGGDFDCYENEQLVTLKGAPRVVGNSFDCDDCNITTLEGAPRRVGNSFSCANNNRLTSLEGAPQEVGGDFYCYGNPQLTSLKSIHKQIKSIKGVLYASSTAVESHVLGLLLIKSLKKVRLPNLEVERIINDHLDGGTMHSAMDCQHALIKEGYTEYAKL